jgi:hypothetical protein
MTQEKFADMRDEETPTMIKDAEQLSRMETDLEGAVSRALSMAEQEMPLPNTLPQPIDAAFVDMLRRQADEYKAAIKDIDNVISDYTARRQEYHRALARANAALDLQLNEVVEIRQ